MKLYTTSLSLLGFGQVVKAGFTFSNVSISPFDDGGPLKVPNNNIQEWEGGSYTGQLPSEWSKFSRVAFTDTPAAGTIYAAQSIGGMSEVDNSPASFVQACSRAPTQKT